MKPDQADSVSSESSPGKDASEQYTDAEGQTESVVRMVSVDSLVRMVTGVAHELKNPLGILLMGIEYLANQVDPENATAKVVTNDMRDAVERADAIVRAAVRYAASKPLVRVAGNLNDAVEAAMLAVEPGLQARRVTLSVDLTKPLPPLLLDRPRVEQAIIQVLDNAIEATPEGGSVSVRTFEHQITERSGDRPGVCVAIEDTGPGISTKLQTRVFLPFFTAHKAGKHAGLGLTVAQTIVQAHGGAISIQSGESRGTLVTMSFGLNEAPLSSGAE